RPGRYVMVKETATGRYWSLSWAPTIDLAYDRYECRHGQGYTKITTEIYGIRGEITYFVAQDVNAEFWSVRLTDLTGQDRALEIYSFTELMMGNALNDIINQPNDKHFTDIHFDQQHQTLVSTRRYWVLNKKVSVVQPNIDWKFKLYFTHTLPVTGFDGSLDKFIGRWRSEANPVAVETGVMGNTEITAGDPVAALQSKVRLTPNGSTEFATILAIVPKCQEDPFSFLQWEQLKRMETIHAKLNGVKEHWNSYLGHVKVETPDEKVNAMLNVWNQYQAAVTFDMARNSGYYHGGLLFGTGMRDQFQDILGMVIAQPKRVRARLLNALRFQFRNGSTLHNFFKMTDSGEKTNHSDTPLWIPFGLVEYLNETADLSILDEVVTYHDEGSGTVYEHLVKAIDFAISATTERGLPKIMNGDWNDTLDHIGPLGKGETVWGGFFLGYMIRKTTELLDHRNDAATKQRWEAFYGKLEKVINTECWDGEWYLRAFRDNGESVGSHKYKQGKIFINAQTWSVISGIAPKERGTMALASTMKHLGTPYGIQIVWPSYTEVEDTIGLISRCVPGKKENGAVFNHASSWFILASIMNGDVETAFDIYTKMLPLNSSANIDVYETEPYVFAEYLTSPDHPTENQASHSWLTGTAVWMYRIALDHILGFRTGLKGITFAPNIPARWGSFRAERIFRGIRFIVTVSNPDGVNSSIARILVDGKEVNTPFIDPAAVTGTSVRVDITLGKK
ncbi:MAG: glycosyl transferase family 36, partial [Bacteroidetes bacterium]|nr:glycosyl transferase family 36 [Bacteroidota bacterium]